MPRRKQPTTATQNKEIPTNRPISLKILGEYLDLSPATISLVLNNAPGVRSIPQETRDRVLAAAKKFDYRPSFYARSLRRNQSFSVGVLVPELSDGYSTLVMSGIEEILIEEGYFYLAASHRRKSDLIEEYPRMLMDRSVEGFIAIDTALQHSLPIPVVAIANHRKIEGVTNISLDHRRAAELTLRHLYQLGHRHIAFMRGQTFSSDSDDRWRSLVAAAKELGIEIHPELTFQLQLNISSPELGYPVVQQLLHQKRPFTALVCFNDFAAIGAIRAFRDHNIRVPEDVSVVGFDDIQGAAFHNPSLTTIRQPLNSMGQTAARLLLQRIRGLKDYPEQVAIVPELIIRESTLPPNPRTLPRHG
ncbi:LacI family DNA-binding transcriptional regulator [Silvibacterium dinghuense]|uniref:LacI family transcriptional regulator n=1 Tax=Silvibacterium dinghuense TaxID=1560006 RepID=A0A4Q1SGV6_9BACT|nr:LacI family DNA-binding transcriptional regulator [Silvibacterium dinghuense]RXS96599.1 LacI family transcriptional regulator [Silvibacterium dinghuense]GGG92121.1 LacI family transcriptional regulator [Silvibacterium dinghuense]